MAGAKKVERFVRQNDLVDEAKPSKLGKKKQYREISQAPK